MSELSAPTLVKATRHRKLGAPIAAAALAAIALFLLFWQPTVILSLDASRAQSSGGSAYMVPVPAPGYFGYRLLTDTDKHPNWSTLQLWEGSRALGPPHTIHDTIRARGGGAYSHWGSTLYFSASDNTDPRTNGRQYEIESGLTLQPEFWWLLLGVAAGTTTILWRSAKPAIAVHLHWVSWALCASAVRWAAVPVIAVTLWRGGASFVRTAGLCLLIYLAGLATLELILLRRPAHPEAAVLINPEFTAVALGPLVVLLATTVLRLVGEYTLLSVILALAVIILCALLISSEFRRRVRRPDNLMSWNFFVWLGCALLFAFLVTPQGDPFTKASSVYLLQGFDLWFPKDPSEWPYFGEKFTMPMLFVTHAIGANMALFSAGDAAQYWTYGQHWVNVLLSPIVPVGAYLTFRRGMPSWAAVLVSVAFALVILDVRIWSLRGETLGWIFGFGFLIVYSDILRQLSVGRTWRDVTALSVILAGLYFALTLTHGVVALVCTLAGLGMTLCFVAGESRWRRWPSLIGVGIPFGLASAMLVVLYIGAFSGSVEKLFFNYDRKPVAGETDPALMFENALFGNANAELDAVRSAPYLPISEASQAFAVVPLAGSFHPEFASLPIAGFREVALANVAAVPAIERAIYLVLLFACCVFYSLHRHLRVLAGHRILFVVSITVYLGLVVFCLYLDAVSVSTFPVAAARRTFGYIRFFYWLAIVAAVADFIVYPIAGRLALAMSRHSYLPSTPVTSAAIAGGFFALLACSLYSDAILWLPRDGTQWPAWRLRQLAITTANEIYPAIPVERFVQDLFTSRQVLFTPASRPSFMAPVEYVRDHTAPGDWVYTNIISDNQFWYLSEGRYSVLEGSAMYQVYSLQRRAADRMKHFAEVAQSGDLSAVEKYGIKYFLLYKNESCRSGCYGYGYAAYSVNIEAFASRPELRRVFENREFVVFARKEGPVASGAVPEESPIRRPSDAALLVSTTRGIRGWIENLVFIDGNYQVQGWAVDPDASVPVRISAYWGGRRVGGAVGDLRRPDVERALGRSVALPGFRFNIDAALISAHDQQNQLRFFAERPNGQRQELAIDPDRSLLPTGISVWSLLARGNPPASVEDQDGPHPMPHR